VASALEHRYLELGFFKFCEARSVYTFVLLSRTIIWRWRLFYKSKSPDVGLIKATCSNSYTLI